MGSLSASSALQLSVRLQGIELGRPTDLLIDTEAWRTLGFVVRCRDEAERFLPFMAAQVTDDEIAVGSALMLLEDVAFYEKRGVSFRSIRNGVIDDVVISSDGTVTQVELVDGGLVEPQDAAVLRARASAA